MQRWIAGVIIGLLIQQTPLVSAEPLEPFSLIARSQWVRFQLVLGHIEVANIHSSQTRSAKRGAIDIGLFEKLTITGDTEIPSVRYERITADENIQVVVINGKRFEITCERRTDQGVERTSFQQAASGDIVLRLGSGPQTQTLRSPSIWHLLISSPEAFEEHVSPLLEVMQPGWRFDEYVVRITDELMRQAQSNDFDSRHTARRLVAKLGSDDFATRKRAQQELRAKGLPILPYLRKLSGKGLTREQQRRVDQICEDIQGSVADSPERVSLWLVEDETIWLAMLGHDELPVRQIAASHLSKRFAKPIGFDPQGNPLERAQQIASLRTRLTLR